MTKTTILDFLRPVPVAAIPRVSAQILRGVRGMCLVQSFVTPVLVLEEHLNATSAARLRLPFFGMVMSAYAAVYVASRAGWSKEHSSALVLAAATVLALEVSFAWVGYRHNENPVEMVIFFLPLLVAAFIPWRPVYALLFIPILLCAWVISHRVRGDAMSREDIVIAVALTGICGVAGAAAGQIHRRLWAQLEETRTQLVAAERLYSLGRLTAGLAHELKTPVAATLNGLQSARKLAAELRESAGHPDVTPDDLREIAGEIDAALALSTRGAEQAATFVHAIREQTRSLNGMVKVPIHLAERLQSVRLLLSHRLKRGNVRVETSAVDPALEIEGDPGKLDQILINLIANALDACEESGQGTCVRVSAAPREGGVLVAVEDDGPGVPPKVRGRIFEPLFTTRGAGGGSGLGLAIARDLAEGAFGGRLELVPSPRGARFELWYPAHGTWSQHRPAWVPSHA